jgi:hypothetical protein
VTADLGLASLDTLLAVTAMLLGLALIVQVVQEIYKYLTNSRARAYHLVLRDYFGPWIDQLYGSGPATRFQVRGPFQFFKSRPTGVLLPLAKDELLEAMDAVAPDWIGHTLEALKNERRLQPAGGAPPSPALGTLVANLRSAAAKATPHSNARRMLDFLAAWGVVDKAGRLRKEVDAQRVLEGLYQRFFPDRIRTEQEFGQLERNYEHAYKRRNLRHTFLFGLLVAVFLNFPFDAIYRRASELSPEEAAALAQVMLDAHEQMGEEEAQASDRNESAGGQAARSGGSAEEPASGSGEETAAGTEEPPRDPSDETSAASDQAPAAGTPPPGPDASEPQDIEELRAKLDEALHQITDIVVKIDPRAEAATPLYRRGLDAIDRAWQAPGYHPIASYFFNCLVTALLISFGAPFWYRLSEALLNVRRDRPPVRHEEEA